MSIDLHDVRSIILPRSDQINFDQLITGPLVIRITEVAAGNKEQPLVVHYEGENGRPYKPGLTMRRVLAHAWGIDSTQWVGKSMELYGEPSIRFGNEAVGGIRISAMSDIPKPIEVSLTVSKGKKSMNRVEVLRISEQLQEAMSAIAAASDNATLKAAKALATKLTKPADIEIALAAYTKRVAELKSAASKPAEAPASALASYLDMIDKATDGDTATLALDEARDVLTADEHTQLADAWRAKWAQE